MISPLLSMLKPIKHFTKCTKKMAIRGSIELNLKPQNPFPANALTQKKNHDDNKENKNTCRGLSFHPSNHNPQAFLLKVPSASPSPQSQSTEHAIQNNKNQHQNSKTIQNNFTVQEP